MQEVEEPYKIFLENLMKDLPVALKHDFLAKSQSQFLTSTKNNLDYKECVVCLDFSENYTCRVQNSVQSEYWNTTQATIHPYVIYHKKNGVVAHTNFVIISEELEHDSSAVNLFNSKLISFMKNRFGQQNIKKIHYFSDGAGSQYKNKYNFVNLLHHKKDFKIDAEWNFFASAHGKGACDGIGGVVKRNAYRSSLQNRHQEKITGAKSLFEWAKTYFKSIHFDFCTKLEHEIHCKKLKNRYSKAKTIQNTRQFHRFVPNEKQEMECKYFSADNKSVVVLVK